MKLIVNRISLPSLKQVAFLNINGNPDLDCVALGKNLSSLITTEKEPSSLYDIGFTCFTGNAKNSWNSSDPEYNARMTGPSLSTSDGEPDSTST